MIKNVLFTLILLFVSISSIAQNQFKYGKILITVTGFENDNGIMFAHLFNREEYFPKESDKAIMYKKVNIINKQSFVVFENVPYGTYAVTVHHDENNNGKMDKTFIGYPAEGFGLSNNPTIYMSVPSFDKCKFIFNEQEYKQIIKLKFI